MIFFTFTSTNDVFCCILRSELAQISIFQGCTKERDNEAKLRMQVRVQDWLRKEHKMIKVELDLSNLIWNKGKYRMCE